MFKAQLTIRSGRAIAVWLVVALGLGCGEGAAPPAEPSARPNLLFIISDTLRADALSCYGGRAHTPHICGLAERGTLFERAYSNAPWTLPSSVSLFTGSLPSAYAQGEEVEALEDRMDFFYVADQEILLGEALAAEGYEVVSFLENTLAARSNTLQGFAERERDPSRLPLREGVLPDLRSDGRRYREMLGILQYLLLAGDRRFFAMQWLRDPHAPYLPPPSARARVEFDPARATHPLIYYMGLGHKEQPELGYRKLGEFQAELTPYEVELLERLYLAEVESVDERVGFLLDVLDRQGLADRTLVVLTSDHGEGFGEHDRFLHGNSFYEELVHVPLIFAGPGLARGWRATTAVSHIDLMPTLCDLMQVDCLEQAQGKSYASLLRRGEDAAAARVVYLENPSSALEQRDALVEASWKLIARREGSGFELYDLATDPREQSNVADAHPEIVERMHVTLRRLRAENVVRRDRNLALTDRSVLERASRATQEQLRALGYIE